MCYNKVVTGVVTLNINCVYYVLPAHRIEVESHARETGNRMAQNLLPPLLMSQVRNLLTCIHTKQLLYHKQRLLQTVL